MWGIWTMCNKFLHEGQNSTTSEIVSLVYQQLPQKHSVKINFDVGFCQQNNKSCSGIILRDDSGVVLWSKAIMHVNIASPFAATAMLGFPIVKIEGDSLAMIRKLKAEGIERLMIGAYISNINTICELSKPFLILKNGDQL
ncbi:hypothetical protein ES288_A13G039100v1 [Gossypium darwinii]|uniref:RNase H type-1 domain-containing protein n=1 Tax=Gossypium darwinii TaxID=34276 RepID=A0A5D2DWG0_GOSDA|nr:hypothetical protein ES288_A13G039100v1 [Gossypium darwinii]